MRKKKRLKILQHTKQQNKQQKNSEEKMNTRNTWPNDKQNQTRGDFSQLTPAVGA
jgi:hypothetical protein